MKCKAPIAISYWHTRTCSRKAVKDGFCTQHHPDSVAERARIRAEKEIEERRIFWLRAYGPQFYKILQRIASGVDNPIELARKALDEIKR